MHDWRNSVTHVSVEHIGTATGRPRGALTCASVHGRFPHRLWAGTRADQRPDRARSGRFAFDMEKEAT